MSSEKSLLRRVFGSAGALIIMGCLGPWNMEVGDEASRLSLHVSCLLVADRSLDTLWVERPQSFGRPYDSKVGFVDTAATEILVIRTFPTPAETTVYMLSSGNKRAWIPVSNPASLVGQGYRYRLQARIRWNAAASFPDEADFRTDTIRSETYVQSGYSVPDTVEAPIEFLHPSLALGLPQSAVRKALSDPQGYLANLYDSLDAIPEAGSLQKLGVDREDLLEYLKGMPVLRPILSGDTLHYIWDNSTVTDIDGGTITRYFRGLSIRHRFDPAQYGGLIITQGYDSTRAYINNPIDQEMEFLLTPGKIDTPSYYQRGNTRIQEVLPKSVPDRSGYPESLIQSNLLFAYTGRNVLYYHAVDSLYYEYYRRYEAPGSNTLLPYSNVENGDGYFIGAILDSLSFVVTSQKDTIPKSELRRAWLKSKGKSD